MSTDKELKEKIADYLIEVQKHEEEMRMKFPPNPPNSVCNHAFISGIKIENSFEPKVNDYVEFFETEQEKVYVWTHSQDKYSTMISEVKEGVKDLPFWKTIGHIIHLAQYYLDGFEISSDIEVKYHWIYYFDPTQSYDDIVLLEDSAFVRMEMQNASIIKATKIEALAPLIELMNRDDRCYTALSQMLSSFELHYCCLICELGLSPVMKHKSHEPPMWEHGYLISKMEAGIVQACRCAESLLGEPPNKSKQSSLLKHKEKWKSVVGINPDDMFDKSGLTYIDFYYKLFFELRNPSAHSYGNINYKLERKKAIEAQCFSALVLRGYIDKNMKTFEESKVILNFNNDLLSRVSENMSTSGTKR